MSERDGRRGGAQPEPSSRPADGSARSVDDPVQALTDFLAAVVEAPPEPER